MPNRPIALLLLCLLCGVVKSRLRIIVLWWVCRFGWLFRVGSLRNRWNVLFVYHYNAFIQQSFLKLNYNNFKFYNNECTPTTTTSRQRLRSSRVRHLPQQPRSHRHWGYHPRTKEWNRKEKGKHSTSLTKSLYSWSWESKMKSTSDNTQKSRDSLHYSWEKY